jgi:1-acyl-sn-glycerol-3-phosphate acyltransferase
MSGPARIRRRWRLGIWYRLAVALLWAPMIVLTKRDRKGEEHLRECPGGLVVATNHISWFDPLVVAHALWDADRPPRFLAKEAVFRVPIIGRIIDGAGQIRVYRDTADASRAVRDAVMAAQAGECVVVYAEGTITRDPAMWPMTVKTGAARIALQSGCPLIPMAQWGAHRVMRPYRKEFNILPRKTMQIRFGSPVDLDDLRDQPITAEVLSVAGDRLVAAITHLLEEIRQETAPAKRYVFRRETQEES